MKLQRIKLRSAVELNDSEMKAVRGSYYGYDDEPIGCYLANCICSISAGFFPHESRPLTFTMWNDSTTEMLLQTSQTCRSWGFHFNRCYSLEPIGYSRCPF